MRQRFTGRALPVPHRGGAGGARPFHVEGGFVLSRRGSASLGFRLPDSDSSANRSSLANQARRIRDTPSYYNRSGFCRNSLPFLFRFPFDSLRFPSVSLPVPSRQARPCPALFLRLLLLLVRHSYHSLRLRHCLRYHDLLRVCYPFILPYPRPLSPPLRLLVRPLSPPHSFLSQSSGFLFSFHPFHL